MINREEFAQKIALLNLASVDIGVAFLWFYRETQAFDERSASELAKDLHDEGFSKPNVTHFRQALIRSPKVVRGKRAKTFQISVKHLDALNEQYRHFLGKKDVKITESVIPFNFAQNTKKHLEDLVREINGTYDYEFYNACAVITRRLMESLIIESYIYHKNTAEIKNGNIFLTLDGLVDRISSSKVISLSRDLPRKMVKIKELGDTAAHDRAYIVSQQDINDLKHDIRKVIYELLVKSGIR